MEQSALEKRMAESEIERQQSMQADATARTEQNITEYAQTLSQVEKQLSRKIAEVKDAREKYHKACVILYTSLFFILLAVVAGSMFYINEWHEGSLLYDEFQKLDDYHVTRLRILVGLLLAFVFLEVTETISNMIQDKKELVSCRTRLLKWQQTYDECLKQIPFAESYICK